MDKIPKRTKLAGAYRSILDKYEGSLIFPFKNPSYYQVIGLLLSIVFLFLTSSVSKIIVLLFILFLDWFDGAAARKFGYTGKTGWMIDVVIDRISEGFIFISEIFNPIGRVFFLLYILNIFLSFYAVKTGKHYLIPIRFLYLILLIVRAL